MVGSLTLPMLKHYALVKGYTRIRQDTPDSLSMLLEAWPGYDNPLDSATWYAVDGQRVTVTTRARILAHYELS